MDSKTAVPSGDLLGKICRHHIARADGARAKFFDKWKENWREFKLLLKEYPWLAWTLRVSIPLLILLLWVGVTVTYNLYSTYRANCDMFYAQVGVEIKRREDLIPNLVSCVSRYEIHEKEIFKHVSDARQALAGAGGVDEKVAASRAMQGALGRLLAIVEQYPNLKASEPVQSLVKELSNTENRIAEGKGKYNESARAFNNFYTNFPTNFLAWCFGIRKPVPYINTDEDMLRAHAVSQPARQGL
ncbi:MAG: LemA family protein [Elusimicrobiota bacterium]|nr:LemA family protein [Elusimicrobiota bacterium]